VETEATTHGSSENKFKLHGYLLTGDEERDLCLHLREEKKDKGFLVLDLDETLIDARGINNQNHMRKPKTPGLVSFESPKYGNDLVYKRPGADEFLRELSQYYEISICCAGALDYAQEMIMRAGW
jgi:TFIIF-interacting CTD phosphatase-like protein